MQNKINIFNFFWFTYLLEFFAPVAVLVKYLYPLDLFFLIKVNQLLIFIVIIFHHFYWKKLNVNFLSALFLVFGVWATIWGLMQNKNLGYAFFTHLYYFALPILGLSYGQSMAKNFNIGNRTAFDKVIFISFILTSLCLAIYAILYFLFRLIPYWGFGSNMHILMPFLLRQNSIFFGGLGTILVLLSGKRATTVGILFVIALHFIQKYYRRNIKGSITIILISILFISFIIGAFELGWLSRFESTISFSLADERSMYIATSGRWQELIGVVNFLSEKPIKWLLGGGFGATYTWDRSIVGQEDITGKHYAHFSPITYIFMFGLPFTLFLYSSLVVLMYKGMKHLKSPFVITFIVLVINASFGANLFVDIRLWVFIGIAYEIIVNKNKNINLY